MLVKGDYVIATKYSDGDPGDHFCVGFYDCSFNHYGKTRYLVVDEAGKPFRANGFQRVAKIGVNRGNWIVAHVHMIECMRDIYSVWHWYRAPWRELNAIDTFIPPEAYGQVRS